MFCKYCGENIDDDSTFCKKCGGKFEMQSDDIIRESDIVNSKNNFRSNNCTLCGVALKEKDKESGLCDKCYILANTPESDSYTYVQPPKKEKSVFVKIVPFIAIAVAVFVVLAYANGGFSNKEADARVNSVTSSVSVSSEKVLTPLEEMNKKYKNEVLATLINWTLDNASVYGTPSAGTSSSDIIDGVYMVGYNFKSKNAFGTKVKHELVAACDTNNDNCKIIMLKLDGETVYVDEAELQKSDVPSSKNNSSSEKQSSLAPKEAISSSISKNEVSSEPTRQNEDKLQENKANLDFAIWCIDNHIADLAGKIVPVENSFKVGFEKIENSENIKSAYGFNYSATDDATLRGIVVICEIDKNGYLVAVEKIINIDKDEGQTILYDGETTERPE